MILPKLNIPGNVLRSRQKYRILSFGGLNLSDDFADGDMVCCRGLSSSAFPSIVQRTGIKPDARYQNVAAAIYHGKKIIIDSEWLYIDGERIRQVSQTEKKFAVMGNRIYMFPDGICINTDTGEITSIEYYVYFAEVTFSASAITFLNGENISGFKKGDGVRITGSAEDDNNKTAIIRDITEDTITFDENSLTATAEGETEIISITRNVPTFDCVCEHNNRIWGAAGNTIYASALGDATNYEVYDGVSTDSYTVAAASPGKFTACISYGNRVLFFKANEIYQVYGTKPANYEMTKRSVPGVEDGAARTLISINEVLYYKGKDGVYAYSGDAPVKIDYKLGNGEYTATAAGADGTDYYISMNNKIYCYDTIRRIWTQFEEGGAEWFIPGGFVQLGVLFETGNTDEKVEWECEFTPFTENTENRKCLSRIYIRYTIERGAWFEAYIKCDSEMWQKVGTVFPDMRKTATFTIAPNRCDKYSIKLIGKGNCKIEQITREIYYGSEV